MASPSVVNKNSESLKKKPEELKPKIFTWTDEESALLLQTVLDYKTSKLHLGQDWESVKTKYDDICKLFNSNYPNERSEEFPNAEVSGQFTKDRIAAKIKKLKLGYRKAIDCGKRSGGGRAVSSLYKECQEIWAGSPAVEKLSEGLETASVNKSDEDSSFLSYQDSPLGLGQSSSSGSPSTLEETECSESVIEPIKKKMKRKKEELLEILEERRHTKCTKQIPVQEQILALAKEDSLMRKDDLELRKKSLDLYQSAERNFNDSLQQLSQNMARTMTEGFMMIASMFQQQQQQQGSVNPTYMSGYQWGYPNSAENKNSSSFTEL